MKKGITKRALEVFDAMPIGKEFDGYSFRRYCGKDFEFTYVDTLLRVLRLYRRECFECTKRSMSKYKKVKNVELGR